MKKNRRLQSLRPFFLAAAGLGALTLLFFLSHRFPLGKEIHKLEAFLKSLGPLAPLGYIAIYVLGVLAFLSAPILTGLGGILFGPVLGVIVVSIASTLAVTVCFLIARYVAQERVEKFLTRFEQFKKLDGLIEEHGAFVVALARLVPILPFPVINYGFGITKIPLLTFVFWSWLCMLPGTIVFVVGIASLKQAIAQGRIPWGSVAFLLLSLAILIALGKAASQRLRSKSNRETL